MRELNLIPYEIKNKKEKTFKSRQNTSSLIIILSVLFIIVYLPMLYKGSVTRKERNLKSQLESKSYILENYDKVNASIIEISKPLELAESVEKDKILVSDIFDKLSKNVPSNVKLNSIAYQDGAISINGETNIYNSAFEFLANLELTEDFNSAKLLSIKFDTDKKVYSLSISIPQKEVEKNEKSK